MAILNLLLDYVNTTTAVTGVLVFLLVWWLRQPRDLPPGPWGLPILGMMPFMFGKKQEEIFRIVCKKYGSVARFSMGSMEFMSFGDYEATKESFIKQGDNFSGKPQGVGFKIRETDSGIGFMEGDAWKEHRRFILSTFRDFGMGKLSLEPRITDEIHHFLDLVKKENGRPYDLTPVLGMSVANVISLMEFGNRFEYDDPEFLLLRSLIADMGDVMKYVMIQLSFSWLRFIPFSDYFTGWALVKKKTDEFSSVFVRKIEEHREKYREGSQNDLIDAFFTEKKKVMEKTGSAENYTDEVLKGTLNFLFFAGSETIVSTVKWALAILMTHPDVLKKVRKEIDDVIGMERNPSISDRSNMPHMEAFMQEVHRFGSIVPNIVHNNLETTTIKGYRIPKRSFANCSLYAIHRDSSLWEDPEIFKPERFLDDAGKLKKTEHLFAFGAGKRNCIGESLARMELFLYITSLLQRFELHVPEGETISLESEMTFVRQPKPFKLCYIPRRE